MALEDLGFEIIRTKVGDAFVSEVLKKDGDFGGEPSGSWIFPQISYCPDGIYASAHIIQVANENRLSKLVDDIPSYPILRGSIPGGRAIMAKLEQRLKSMNPLSTSTVDGIRLTFKDGWLLVRGSGTEPKIRVTAEAKYNKRARELYECGVEAVKECLEAKL